MPALQVLGASRIKDVKENNLKPMNKNELAARARNPTLYVFIAAAESPARLAEVSSAHPR